MAQLKDFNAVCYEKVIKQVRAGHQVSVPLNAQCLDYKIVIVVTADLNFQNTLFQQDLSCLFSFAIGCHDESQENLLVRLIEKFYVTQKYFSSASYYSLQILSLLVKDNNVTFTMCSTYSN